MGAVEEAELAGCKRTYFYMATGLKNAFYEMQR